LCVLPTCEPVDSKPWPIPVVVPAVTGDAETLVAASREAVRIARHEVDTAPRRPVVQVPGLEQLAEAHTVPQMYVAELDRFAAKLEIQLKEIYTA
jgi:hypothetical protein